VNGYKLEIGEWAGIRVGEWAGLRDR